MRRRVISEAGLIAVTEIQREDRVEEAAAEGQRARPLFNALASRDCVCLVSSPAAWCLISAKWRYRQPAGCYQEWSGTLVTLTREFYSLVFD